MAQPQNTSQSEFDARRGITNAKVRFEKREKERLTQEQLKRRKAANDDRYNTVVDINEKKFSTDRVRRDEMAKMDERRGIQNTQARFDVVTQNRLLQENLKRDLQSERLEKEAVDSEGRLGDQFEEGSQDQMGNNESVAHQLYTHRKAIRGISTKTVKKKIGAKVIGRKLVTRGLTGTTGIVALMWCAVFQFFFALGSAIFFGMSIASAAACDTTLLSVFCYVAEKVTDLMSYIPGVNIITQITAENIGLAFLALVILLTALVFIVSLFLFFIQGISVFRSTAAILGTSLAIAFNILPFINLIPWIELWAGYWIVYGAVDTVKDLSNMAKTTMHKT